MNFRTLPPAACLLCLVSVALALAQAGRGARPTSPSDLKIPAAPAQPPPVTDPGMVLLNVSVTGPRNAAVPGLGRERFQVFEDGVEQAIQYFWEDSRPMTVGFVFDDSERMSENNKAHVLQDAAQSFLKGKGPSDEFFLVRMSNLAAVHVSFTTDPARLPRAYPAIGETALYDAIHVALDVIKEAANPRKFLFVITSGGDRCCSDNNKTTTDLQLTSFALKQSVQIFTVFVVDSVDDLNSEFVHRDANLLNDLASWTGGRMYNAPNSSHAVEALAAEVARGLKTQYIIGYKPARAERDGKRRGVRVKVTSPDGGPKLDAWTKAGYYAPKER